MGKLVRDRIPEIIRGSGKEPIYEVLEETLYKEYLHEKLKEEVQEYLESGELEEICDVLEVLYAIMDLKKTSRTVIEEMRRIKAEKNGTFHKRYFLKDVVSKE